MLTWVGWYYGAPGPSLWVVAVSALLSWGFFVAGRRSGCRLTDAELECFAGRWRRSVALSDVAAYELTPWSDGAPWLRLHLSDGDVWLLPAYCIGSAPGLADHLGRLGIPAKPLSP